MIEEKILIFDEYVAKTITEKKYVTLMYPLYFSPEIKAFIGKEWFPKYEPNSYFKNEWVEEIKKELPENFYQLRKAGENESYICKLIREDNITDFIPYVNKTNFPLNLEIEPSIYETNSFPTTLQNERNNKKSTTLINYAAFFGSIQIIKYLLLQKVEIDPYLWAYSIHSQNAELIYFLESLNIKPKVLFHKNFYANERTYDGCFLESIKCTHNRIADYFLNNHEGCNKDSNDTFFRSLRYYNFEFIQKEHVKESSFNLLCKYGYYLFVDYLLTEKDIEINDKSIQYHIFQLHSNHIFQSHSKSFL